MSLSRQRDAEAVTVAVHGEIDLSTVEDLEQEIDAATQSDGATVIIDLGGVTFMDSAGINILLKGRRLADERGKQYRVTNAHGLVRQILDVTGVWHHLSSPVG